MSWNNTCVPWLSIIGCTDKMIQLSNHFSLFYLILVSTMFTFYIVSGFIRIKYKGLSVDFNDFVTLSLHIILWAILHILYHGFRMNYNKNNHNSIILSPIVSAFLENFGMTILISSIMFLIKSWMNITDNDITKKKTLFDPFWIITSTIFIITTTVLCCVGAMNPQLYLILYRIVLGEYAIMLAIDVILLIYYGSKIYDIVASITTINTKKRSKIVNNMNSIRVKIIIILSPCVIFAIVHCIILHIIDKIFVHFIIWTCYYVGASLYCLFWAYQNIISIYNEPPSPNSTQSGEISFQRLDLNSTNIKNNNLK